MALLHAFDLVPERSLSARAGLIRANSLDQSRFNAFCVQFGYAWGVLLQPVLMEH
jgi:hypothetical protein